SLCATSVAVGQSALTPLLSAPDGSVPPVTLEPKADSLNQVSLGFQLGFNIKTKFKHVGGFPAGTNPGSTNALSNHFYDEGYNLVDSTGNNHLGNEGTWNWGFTGNNNFDANGNGAQVHNNGQPNGTIDMHSLSSKGGSTGDISDDPQPGLLLTYARQLFR